MQEEDDETAAASPPPRWDVVERPPSRCPPDVGRELLTCERLVVLFAQLKDYLGSYWLAPWFFVYIYPSVLVYETHGFVGPFVYCNIVQMLFFIVFEFWDESYNWTPLHDTVRKYSSKILGYQNLTKNVDELILFSTWVISWAAVPTICFINGHIFELPSDRIERLSSYLSMMTIAFVMAYIFVLLWIDMNLLDIYSSICEHNASTKNPIFSSELIENIIIEPDGIPDLEAVYEDISITDEFRIDNTLLELTEALNENDVEKDEPLNCLQIEQGEEVTEQEMDMVSLSSSTLSEFDVITDEEINLLNH